MAKKKYTFTTEEAAQSYRKYRKELWQVLYLSLSEAFKHVSRMDGIRFEEVLPEVKGKFSLGHYKKDRKGKGALEFGQRTFKTRHGNLVEPIDPNELLESIFGSDKVRPDQLKSTPIVKIVQSIIMNNVGEDLFERMWTAVYDPEDDAAFFDGLISVLKKDMIGQNEENKVKISAELGNLTTLAGEITEENAEDVIKKFYWDVVTGQKNKKLGKQKLKYFMSESTYHLYTESYQTNHGALPYNQQYDKHVLEGAPNVEFAPMSNIPDNFLLLTPKDNIFLLFNNSGEEEDLILKDSLDSHYEIDAIMDMFFGTQFRSVDKSVLHVGMLAADQPRLADKKANKVTVMWVDGSNVVKSASGAPGAEVEAPAAPDGKSWSAALTTFPEADTVVTASDS